LQRYVRSPAELGGVDDVDGAATAVGMSIGPISAFTSTDDNADAKGDDNPEEGRLETSAVTGQTQSSRVPRR